MYFRKKATETIELAEVIRDKDGKVTSRRLTGESLSFVRKDTPVDVQRTFMVQFAQAQAIEQRIKNLQAQQTNPDISDEEFLKLAGRIEEFQKKPDALYWMCQYIASSLQSWDYCASEEDANQNRPIPLETEAIRQRCDVAILAQIVDYLNKSGREDEREGKDLAENSPSGSRTKEASAVVRTSTSTM